MPIMQGPRLSFEKLSEQYRAVNRLLKSGVLADAWSDWMYVWRTPLFHCSDCAVPDLCKNCTVAAHSSFPFHDLREWSERVQYYIPANLYDMGLRIGLGHEGSTCPHPAVTSDNEQIKDYGWWPMRSNFISALPMEALNGLFEGEGGEGEESAEESEAADSGEESAEGIKNVLEKKPPAGNRARGGGAQCASPFDLPWDYQGPPSAILQLTRPPSGSGLGGAVLALVSAFGVLGRTALGSSPLARSRGRATSRRRVAAEPAQGHSRHPINVLSSPSSPEVTVTSTRRARLSSAQTRVVRHSAERAGIRARLNPPVSPATLYLTEARPPDLQLQHAHQCAALS
ncbi:hypothetical protein B0H13DRAFT_2354188 [Mycena leptocephala]|nr:hypothetical protein B0H13DRAFT_2354188 [Mycena leptocephala]